MSAAHRREIGEQVSSGNGTGRGGPIYRSDPARCWRIPEESAIQPLDELSR